MTEFHSPQEHLNAQDMQDQLMRDFWRWLGAAIAGLIFLGFIIAVPILWPHVSGESVLINQIMEGLE